jgi:hypothetical protein
MSLSYLDNALSEEQSQGKSAKKQSETESHGKNFKKQSNIDGIGYFKIGKTKIDIIKDLESEFGTETEIINDTYGLVQAKKRSNSIFQFIPKKKNSYEFNICPDVKEYYIPVYVIADMEITQLNLKFYKDVLYEIKCDSTRELREALALKYGEPEKKIDKKSVSCFYKITGKKVTLEEETFYSSWYNRKIVANDVLTNWYNVKCEKILVNYINIYDTNIKQTVWKCKQDIRKRFDDTNKQERLKKLKDF